MNMDPGTWSTRVAVVIGAEMAARRLTPAALAEVLGVTEPTVRKRLDGEIALDLVEVERIAAWLGTSPSELLARAGGHAS
jgi:plasmid maintenance system antidote protein VapI